MKKLMVLVLFLGTSVPVLGQTYDFSTSPYSHMQDLGACRTYSGNSCINTQQWGFIAIDPVARAMQMRSGIGKQGAPYQSPKTYISPKGDCNNSSTVVVASAGALKWVLTNGTNPSTNCASNSCAVPFVGVPVGCEQNSSCTSWTCASPRPSQAVQVWKYESGNWIWKGQVGADLFLYRRGSEMRCVGDVGYIQESHPGIPPPPPVWSKMDLNAVAIVQTGIPEANVPPGEAQDGIGGVHYALSSLGNMNYRLSVVGVAPPTSTPGAATATATKTPTGGVPSKTPTALTNCCIEGINCPPGAPIPRCTPTACWNCTKTMTPTFVSTKTPTPTTSCGAPSETALCLGNRFRVTADWTKPNGESGHATAIPRTSDTGEFWFFSASNIEMVVKVLNGCGVNAKWWAFAGGLTNVKVDWTVTDTTTGVVREYHNAQSVAFQPVQDTGAFPCGN